MGKTITIEDDVYKLLRSLKEDRGDSFSKVIRRHVHKPLETAGELLAFHESEPPPYFDKRVLDIVVRQRGRRPGGRK